MHDPVSDMLSQIRNASAAGHKTVSVPFSKFKLAIAQALARHGYIEAAEEKGKDIKKTVEITLVPNDRAPRIRGHKRISKPSRRVYYKGSDIHPIKNGYGTLVLSTPKGVLSGDDAKKAHVGGEVLFAIW